MQYTIISVGFLLDPVLRSPWQSLQTLIDSGSGSRGLENLVLSLGVC